MDVHLSDIRTRLRSNRFVNEAAIRQGIVDRLLSLLSWPVYDTDIVSPEYSLEGRRVDYALCHPPRKPLVFIEVKQPGQNDGADRQLFEYAFHRGVPMAILTNGQEWHFFLPAEQGDYGERRVYKLDVLERDVEESVDRLQRYLDYRRVCSGDAMEAARKDYRDVTKEREIQRNLPDAWNKLIDESDSILLDLVAERVESLCGYKPDAETVTSFLVTRLRLGSHSPRPPIALPRPTVETPPLPVETQLESSAREPMGFVLRGQRHSASNKRDVLLRILRELDGRDSTFLERFSRLSSPRGNRRYIARSREALYPGSPHLALVDSYSRELSPGSGWWVDLNLSTTSIEKVIHAACQVASIDYGTDLVVSLGAES